ncbi:Lsr2 family protein, partial [Brevibacterium sp. p3-SID960]
GSRSDTAQIRKWAQDKGYEVSDRGRIPSEIVEAYDNAH